ncbi:GNAT family N-acetyltransferase [Marinomonas sp. C2222]|uniref:GNAT family N-acetyltransferase n=1 Tax=Marinomonas sargassi TaxID=2984494 RepID=A0ABT2YTN9_9GAMM|nr:GNAT family N-acetyltransferase [Marinomonas sargassi]MCV2403264.1 GNAT family N-acetyltransferase [Marinomonas sargassi]
MTIIPYTVNFKSQFIQFFQTAMEEMGFEYIPETKDSDVVSVEAIYQTNGGCFMIACDEGQVVGSIGVKRFSENTAELKRFYVLKHYQGNGFGFQLLDKAVKEARTSGFHSIRLGTTHESNKAINMFQTYGFYQIARYNQDPYAEVFMELDLRESGS